MTFTCVVPPKLRPGDQVRVVAPSRSRAMVNEHDHSAISAPRFADLGLTLTFGDHVDERDIFDSASIASRVADLHAAFADAEVGAILTVIGGFNSNELLPYLDWELIRTHPKILCGYSDITALQNALLTRAGLVTYSGPHWSSFGMQSHFDQTMEWFVRTVFDDGPVVLEPLRWWTDDAWFLDQDHRTVLPTRGWWPIRPGHAAGMLVGGNLCTFNLLQGTPYRPALDSTVLMVEDDERSNKTEFARDLTSLLQLPDARNLAGLVIGRFRQASGMTREIIEEIVDRQPALEGVPVLANVDFGHTNPQATLPIGGQVDIVAGETPTMTLTRH